MGSIHECLVCLIVFSLVLDIRTSACQTAVYTWPLGEGILRYEISNKSWAGSHHNIAFNDGPPELNYSAIQFNASYESYIEFPVQNNALLEEDYAIMLHLFVETDGVFLYYKSDDYNSSGGHVESIKFEIFSGTVGVTIYSSLFGVTQRNLALGVPYNSWLKLVYSRNRSTNDVAIEILTEAMDFLDVQDMDEWIDELWTSLPGTLRVGGSIDGNSYFSGRATCVNIIPCFVPNIYNEYSAACVQAHWPTLPTTTKPTTPSTTMTTPTITTSTPTTTTSTPTTTTSTPTTTTTPTSTMPTSTTTTTVQSTQAPRPFQQYRLVATNTAFADGEALDAVSIVPHQLACSRKCSAHVACWSFVFQTGGGCWLGPRFPETMNAVGARLYELI